MRFLRRLNLLDWILAATGLAAIGVVVYRDRTQGFLDWVDLAYMAIAILGYSKYRTTKVKVSDHKADVDKEEG